MTWQNVVMLAIGCFLLYLAIGKKFEPLLLTGIAFGCILTNLPGAGLYNQELWNNKYFLFILFVFYKFAALNSFPSTVMFLYLISLASSVTNKGRPSAFS